MPSTSRTNRYIFTINNCSEKEEQGLADFASLTDTVYLVYGRRIGKFGRKQVQGFLMTRIRHHVPYFERMECFSRAHIDITRERNGEVSERCKKDGNYEEFGHLPTDGSTLEQSPSEENPEETELNDTNDSSNSSEEESQARLDLGTSKSDHSNYELSDYEKIRAMNIERNNARLRSLGLLKETTDTTTKGTTTTSKATSKENVKKKCTMNEAPKKISYGTRANKRSKRNVEPTQATQGDAIWV